MPKPEFENGIPRALLEAGDDLPALQTRFGNFAAAILEEIKEIEPETPRDVVTFGDNWLQLVETRDLPHDDLQRALRRALPQQGAVSFGDMWPIHARRRGETIYDLMQDFRAGVEAGALDARILDSLAVLDITKVNPPLNRQTLLQRIDTPWGTRGILPDANTVIYHITSGYARQRVEDIQGTPGSDYSSSILWRGPKKFI